MAFPDAGDVRRGLLLTYKNGVAGVCQEAHGHPKLSAVKTVTTIPGCVVVGRVRIDHSAGRYAHTPVVIAHETGILQGCHVLEEGALALQSVVGPGGISGIAAKLLAAKTAPKAYKTGQGRVLIFMLPYVLILFCGDAFRQFIAVLNTPE